MLNRSLLVILSISTCLKLHAQTTMPAQPKLVVGIVVDQMSYEFLYRYTDVYGEGGFKRLLKEGFSCENTHYNYIPTYTGPGHASIYTGSVPAINGIVSNDWYNEDTKSFLYVASDPSVRAVGADSLGNRMSPKNMLTTTVTDMLKLSNQQRSKVIGIAMKDRSAILPAGHTANAAYWYDGFANSWVTSTYYMNTLPQWVIDINTQRPAEKYMNQNWNLFLPASSYKNATADSMSWETVFVGEQSATFPHYLLFTGTSESIKSTPFGNSLTTEFAQAAVKNELLGKDNITDFLCVSYSSTDYVGHAYGPHSVETEDTYIRLDRDIAAFLTFLDTNVGKGNYLVFLTADHGVSPVPQYLKSLKIPSGTTTEYEMLAAIKQIAKVNLGDTAFIAAYTNQQIYLNDDYIKSKGGTKKQVFDKMLDNLMIVNPAISNVVFINEIEGATLNEEMKELVINGIYPKRSGDIQILMDPYWFEAYRPTGTTHGSHYNYDTHVPLVFFGWKIKHGESYNDIHVTDIAPTISSLLKISEPNGCVGKVIGEVMK
ncbi:MAG: alkaline phosphatase PafA [Chitinophagales bacterium]